MNSPEFPHNAAPPLAHEAVALPAPTDTGQQQAVLPPQVTLPARGTHRSRHARRSTSGDGSTMRMLLWGLLALAVLGGGALATGAIQFNEGPGGPLETSGQSNSRTDSWSYFHDSDYDTTDTGAKWETDHTRSTDPDEAVLGDTSRWDYDGAYKYGPYGSDGMDKRSHGTSANDPLYSPVDTDPGPFVTAGDELLDPTGGAPIGEAASAMSNPYFDPYAGYYTNPYANRIRLSYGEGYGEGAALSATHP